MVADWRFKQGLGSRARGYPKFGVLKCCGLTESFLLVYTAVVPNRVQGLGGLEV